MRDNAFLIAGQVMHELRELMPLGANIDELAAHMKFNKPQLAAAFAHLEAYDIIEIENGAARVSPKSIRWPDNVGAATGFIQEGQEISPSTFCPSYSGAS